jgi:hypothetical protein
MTVKLSPHFQQLPKWASKVDYPGDWVKVMDPGRGVIQRFPLLNIVGRWYMQDEGFYISRGAAGADAYFRLMWPHYDETRGEIAVIEAVNEPGCQEPEQVRLLAEFLLRWIELMHQAGFIVAVPAFSVGNPPIEVIGALERVWIATDYADLHEYGVRAMWEEWRGYTSLRHRMIYDHMATLGIPERPLFITETGIDRGGDGYRKKPGNTPWPEYMDQLCWYERRLQEDPYVEAAFLFTSGATQTWRSFSVEEAEWRDLAKRLG